MSIEVRGITDTSIRVGKKVVYRDIEGNWVAATELTTNEIEALNNFLIEGHGRSSQQ